MCKRPCVAGQGGLAWGPQIPQVLAGPRSLVWPIEGSGGAGRLGSRKYTDDSLWGKGIALSSPPCSPGPILKGSLRPLPHPDQGSFVQGTCTGHSECCSGHFAGTTSFIGPPELWGGSPPLHHFTDGETELRRQSPSCTPGHPSPRALMPNRQMGNSFFLWTHLRPSSRIFPMGLSPRNNGRKEMPES